MAAELIINVTFNETRIAFLENGLLVNSSSREKTTRALWGTYTKAR